jgi:hypothetical protein
MEAIARYTISVVVAKLLKDDGTIVRHFKTWHFRHDWLFTPFVVVVGCKYFLPVPECLLFDWVLSQ